jgi:lysophospholipase L1-like esterase
MTSKSFRHLSLASIGLIVPAVASAQIAVNGLSTLANQSFFDGTILTNNLAAQATVTGTTPSLGSLAGLDDGEGSPIGLGDTSANLTNDCYFDGTGGFGTPNLLASTPSVTFTFNTNASTGGNANGYTISSISSVYGWHDHASFSDQDYSISYSTVSNPNLFTPLTTVAYNPFDPVNDQVNAGSQFNSSLVTVSNSSGPLATSVAAIKFTFTAYDDAQNIEQTGQVIREISIASPNLPPKSSPTILPLGDSITDGYSTPGGYRIKLYSDFGGNVQFLGSQSNGPANLPDKHNEGHSGYRIDQVDADLTGLVSSSPAPDTNNGGDWLTGGNGTGRSAIDPNFVLLHIGTNDATQGATAPVMESRLTQLLKDLKTDLPNSQVIVASLIPRTDSSADEAVEEQYNAAMPSIVASMGGDFHFLDMHDVINPNTDLADGVHPNIAGYNKMADAWYAEIQAISVPEPASAALLLVTAAGLFRPRKRA